MPQMQLPFFPPGTTEINVNVAFLRKGDSVTYYHGHLAVFKHNVNDISSFRLMTSQLYLNGAAKQIEISRAFGVTPISVKRSVKLFLEKGSEGFYETRGTRGGAVLPKPVLGQAQQLLDQGCDLSDVSEELGIKKDTLRKAVSSGRLRIVNKAEKNEGPDSNAKSTRSIEDNLAPMGMGASNTLERVAASIGGLPATVPSFTPSLDVPNAGVLFALPALLAVGLLKHTREYFVLPPGFYQLETIFLLLAFMALARIKTVEDLRYCAPGEWGKLLGLDRIPEAKTLREKINILSNSEQPSKWASELAGDWMRNDPADASLFYIDGHVRVYSGHQTKLPKHYVARQKLCLRATTDYWVNAMDGRPFFLINKEVDPGLIKVIEGDIVHRLEKDVPNQPSKEELDDNPLIHRFTLIFDREGYSPKFFLRMKKKGIACISYHKYPKINWPEEEFELHQVKLSSGNVVEMKLAERGTRLENSIWVREIRKLNESGHQTSVLTTDFSSDLKVIAAAMFARWSQENFLKYMRNHYNLDRLITYSTEEIPDTTTVVNPDYRNLDKDIRKKVGRLNWFKTKFGDISLTDDIEPKKVEKYLQKKAELREEILPLEKEVEQLKKERKEIKKHITIAELPKKERFTRLSAQSKYLIDTIKMVAYRAETAMANVLREEMKHPDESRSLLRSIYSSEGDILPDLKMGTLTVRLHHLANKMSSKSIQHLCNELNSTETIFPGTNLRLICELVSK